VDASAGRTYYDYEGRNLLTRVDFPGTTATNYFEYNALGERIRKDDSTGGKKYTWDGLLPIVEKDLSGTTVQRMIKGYTPIGGIGEYALQDVNGTVSMIGHTEPLIVGSN
jgi:YD repeat-containing protein